MNIANELDIKKHRLLLHEQAESLLRQRIQEHNLRACNCDKKTGLCYAGLFLAGKISSIQVVEDLAKDIETTEKFKKWHSLFHNEKNQFLKKQLEKQFN